MIIHINYPGSLHVVVQINVNVKIVGVGHFWSLGHNFNNMEEVQ